MRKVASSIRWICTVLGTVALLWGCGQDSGRRVTASSAALSRACILPNGLQDNSLQGQWQRSSLPLRVALYSGSGFSGIETSFLTAAAATWNTFFSVVRGANIFDYGSASAPHTSSTNITRPDCTQTTSTEGTVVYKRGTWTQGSGVIALTTFCLNSNGNSGVPFMYNAIIELNYQNYFTANSRKFPDLQSIMTHELGHLLGLDHSCGALRTGRPNVECPGDDAEDSNGLASSVMYPTWKIDDTSGLGEVKRSLNTNDQGRALCLY